MNNGTIITPLTPDENFEINKEESNNIYTQSDSPDIQIEKVHLHHIKKCCKKWNCFEIFFLFFIFIINLSILNSIIIQFIYVTSPNPDLLYGIFSFSTFFSFCEMVQKDDYHSDSFILLIVLIVDASLLWGIGYFYFRFFENYDYIKWKSEFIANLIIYSKYGEITIWILLIFLFMYLTKKRTGHFIFIHKI